MNQNRRNTRSIAPAATGAKASSPRALRPQRASTTIVGRISREPETTTTAGGVSICRLTVAREAEGPASSPVVVDLYASGELARRCGRGLGCGDLIEVHGELAPPRSSARRTEVRAAEVKLWEKVNGRPLASSA